MPYNHENYYKRVAEMQDVVRQVQCEHPGLPLTRIFNDYICCRFHISYSTFTRWLGIPAKREIEKLSNIKSN